MIFKKKAGPNISSELRRDLVTGDWIVIAKERAKRPSDFATKGESLTCLADDPFRDPQASGNGEPVLKYENKDKEWTLQVIPNKFPAFTQQGECAVTREEGPYEVIDGRGHHEVVITRDCDKHFALFSKEQAEEVIRAYNARYNELKKDSCVKYVSVFHNHGKEAGASVVHPHSQIIAIPVVPPDVSRSLRGSKEFNEKDGGCVHCTMIEWEKKEGSRVIYENDTMIAFCPYVSRTAFEIRVFPKEHQSRFEDLDPKKFSDLGDAMRESLAKLYHALGNPSYNFFLHTAPVNDDDYSYYHWHMEIIPKTLIWAGFELATGVEISTIEPERAAQFLREAK